MNTLPFIAVVIVNYNGYELSRDCLASFAKVNYSNYFLIVVDNASNDNSIPKLKVEFPHVHYVESTMNTGFTGGNNLGIKRAYELEAEYVFLLNNDTIVSDNILDELVTFSINNPEIGIVGPLTYFFESMDTISFGGGHINRNTGMYYHLNKGKKLKDLRENVIDCNFIEGAAMFMRTDLAVEVGGLSNVYFLTSEESELCVRVADKGYRLAVITSCSVWHKISQSLKGGSTLRDYYVFRNKLLFVKRNAKNLRLRDLTGLAWFYFKCFASSVRRDKNCATAKGILLALFDFFTGVTGPGRYAKKLNASCEGASLP
ncbi:MAG: glycosyltransferase family 2 protein [Chlorobium sp.]|nr:glycosyltransferase family 2 protein [Chlorobium sp.]